MTEPAREHWSPIADAPRDGRILWLTAFFPDGEQFEVHPMQWCHLQRNALFPSKTGMWTHPSGAYTWNEDGEDGGPTHFMEIASHD